MNKKDRLKALFAQMKDMNEGKTAFDQTQWDALKAEADKLKGEIEAEAVRDAAVGELNNFLNEPEETPVALRLTDETPRDRNERPFHSLGEQLQAVAALAGRNEAGYPVDQAENRLRAVNAASGVSTSVAGEVGFLVQTDIAAGLRNTAMDTGVLASRVDRMQIGPNSDGMEFYEVEDKDKSQGPWGGSFRVYRKGEKSVMETTIGLNTKPREIRLEDMYGLLFVTNRTLRDTVALTSFINRGFSDNFSWKLDNEIWEGNGSGQCLGIMNSPVLVTVAKETGQAAGTLTVNNILKMFYSMPGRYLPNAAWFVSQVGVQEILPTLTIKDHPVYMPPTGLAGGMYGTLLGRPIIPIEQAPALGSKGDIVLADFKQYLMVEKGGTEMATSIHVKFLTDETAFRFIMRNNGQPWDNAPITTAKGNKKMSPFITLAERA